MTDQPHRGYEPFELGENMDEDLGLFEAATHAPRIVIEPLRVGTVLVAGGPATGTAAAAACTGLARAVVERVGGAGVVETEGTSVAVLLDDIGRTRADLLVTSAEILPDDVCAELFAAASIPVLCNGRDRRRRRGRPADAAARLDTILLPLFADTPAARRGLAWACGLAAAAGRRGDVHVLTSPAARIAADVGRLLAAIQRDATARGFRVETMFQTGTPRAEILGATAALRRLPLVVLPQDAALVAGGATDTARLAIDLLRGSAGAVLVG
jgi:hypothetical protein